MTGVTSSISLSSNALLLLGHEPIASFTDGTTGATIAANLYKDSYLNLISSFPWGFATKKASLVRMTESPLNEYQYAYQIPTDCMYVLKTTSTIYRIFESTIYTNEATLSITYIFSISEDRLPPYFIKACEFYLAAQFAIPLTGDLDKASYYDKKAEKELRKAKYLDSTQHPQDANYIADYIAVRW